MPSCSEVSASRNVILLISTKKIDYTHTGKKEDDSERVYFYLTSVESVS